MSSNTSEQEVVSKEFLDTQRKFEQVNERRRILIAQESENQMVNKELNLLESDAVIYKLVGSVMVKQSLDDAKSTVSKRLEYIAGEIESVNKAFESLQSKLVETSNQVGCLHFILEIHTKIAFLSQNFSFKDSRKRKPSLVSSLYLPLAILFGVVLNKSSFLGLGLDILFFNSFFFLLYPFQAALSAFFELEVTVPSFIIS
ncbi:prefoldin subunit 6 [Cryptosporidium felis]|nr:prefoldin subunit 6 [Cryptosporidium felis]